MEEIIQDKCGLAIGHTFHDVFSFGDSVQHRGREVCGFFAVGDTIDVVKLKGLIKSVDLVDMHEIFPTSKHYHTYGVHVRYATRGREDRILEDAHPHTIGGQYYDRGSHIIIKNCDAVAIHNGQANLEGIFNSERVKNECDTKLLLEYYWQHGAHKIMEKIQGSFTLGIADKRRKEVIFMRDRYGITPGCLGLKDGKYCGASEDIALRKNGAKFIEDLEPGAIYYLADNGGYRREKVVNSKEISNCFFQHNYVCDAESIVNGVSVAAIRRELGIELAKEFPIRNADIISPIPRCPEIASRSYAEVLGKEHCFHRIFYKLNSERAFQGTNKEERNESIRKNLFLNPEAEYYLKNSVVVLIDDSTIRGNNSKHAINLVKAAGAKEVYLLNYTPKIGIIGEDNIKRGCLWGVDMPPHDDFVVRTKIKKSEDIFEERNSSNEEISKKIGVEVRFLSKVGMLEAFQRRGINSKDLCYFCIGGGNPFK
jgi:amidophosphoribosyltransferase